MTGGPKPHLSLPLGCCGKAQTHNAPIWAKGAAALERKSHPGARLLGASYAQRRSGSLSVRRALEKHRYDPQNTAMAARRSSTLECLRAMAARAMPPNLLGNADTL